MSGRNSTSIGKISRRPASMSKIITSFAGFVKLPKFIMGPTCARPGPMLFKVAAMAVKFVTISKPSRLMSRKDTTKMKKYAPINTLVVQKGISAVCMHTNLDAAEGGVNEVLAGIFGMRDWEVFADGCGRVGEVEPITVPELARKAQAVLGGRCNRPRSGPAVQVKFADTGRTVKRLAVISGAGGSMFEDALAVGADCLLTGEANHHAAIDAVRLGLSLVAAGHYATEFPVCAAIADRLHAAFPELEVRVSGENRDPFTYI